MKFVIYILFAAGCFFSILHWLNNFNVSPDSSNFITAGKNLEQNNSLFVYANWPSRSFEPVTEPYTEYMPGLPMMAVICFAFTDNPDIVMLALNSIFIALVFFASLLVLKKIKVNYFYQILFLLMLTFFGPFRFIYSYFWTESFFIFWSLITFYFAAKLIDEDNKSYWILGCAAAALSSLMKIYGILNCVFFIIPFVIHKKSFLKPVMFVAAAAIFIIGWYLRNEFLYGYFTSSHKLFGQFNSYNVLRPFKYILFLLGNDKPANLWAAIFSGVSLAPLFLITKNKEKRIFRIWLMLFLGAAINFFGIYFLSLFSKFDYLESRLLAPVFIFVLLAFIVSSSILFERAKPFLRILFAAIPAVFIALNPVFEKSIDRKININFPKEHFLWDEIYEKKISQTSSHYITDFNYNHQIYGNKPQRIITNDSLFQNIDYLKEITSKGVMPFIVLRNNELPYFYFEKGKDVLGYERAGLENKEFTVYVKK